MTAAGRSATLRASLVYVLLWIPALLISALISLGGLLAFASAPMWSALSFLLALPAVLVGIRSFRVSSFAFVWLLLWDVFTTTWPHVNVLDLFSSLTDVLLLVSTVLTALVAFLSPFASIVDFVRHLRRS